jgi:hypothetical protein
MFFQNVIRILSLGKGGQAVGQAASLAGASGGRVLIPGERTSDADRPRRAAAREVLPAAKNLWVK